ncbi:uncharacterized protein LOC125226835 [Leguminivora glycinivorella]|uniref:uncharacterized protein LOC125226835 n=1 Tax=Leguminivora glycinivorella TaxID=1035111 RepID=UPI00200F863C|nr:uncharacterized protein LOC125226835 [Leguminivora glycinivorella]
MSPLARSLLALAALLAAADAGREQVLFGFNAPRFIRLNEVTLNPQGGWINVKNYCSNVPSGALVVASNSFRDRAPYISGDVQSINVVCMPLGPYTTCDDRIRVNITQFC